MTDSESWECMGKAATQRRGQVPLAGRIPPFREQAALSEQWILSWGTQYADYIRSIRYPSLYLRNKSMNIFSSNLEFAKVKT